MLFTLACSTVERDDATRSLLHYETVLVVFLHLRNSEGLS